MKTVHSFKTKKGLSAIALVVLFASIQTTKPMSHPISGDAACIIGKVLVSVAITSVACLPLLIKNEGESTKDHLKKSWRKICAALVLSIAGNAAFFTYLSYKSKPVDPSIVQLNLDPSIMTKLQDFERGMREHEQRVGERLGVFEDQVDRYLDQFTKPGALQGITSEEAKVIQAEIIRLAQNYAGLTDDVDKLSPETFQQRITQLQQEVDRHGADLEIVKRKRAEDFGKVREAMLSVNAKLPAEQQVADLARQLVQM